MRTADDLRQKQALPLSLKVALTKERIRQWVNEYGEDGVFVSYSGGKDSTVLLHIVRSLYPNIKAVFCDTGLEYPSIRAFVKKTENVEILKPKMTFREVINKYGYPVISKEIAAMADITKKYIAKVKTDSQTDMNIPAYAFADLLGVPRRLDAKQSEEYAKIKEGNIPDIFFKDAPTRVKMLYGRLEHKEKGQLTGEYSRMYDRSKYRFLIFSPFRVSDRCCRIMKKNPSHKYQVDNNMNPMTGQMADESRLRKKVWIQHGCNMFDVKYPISNPMSFWTEQDVFKYIKENNIEIAAPYGEIVPKNGTGYDGQMTIADMLEDYSDVEYTTTKNQRTGCVFCLFGINSDKERFVRLADEEPQLYDYVMRGGEWSPDGIWQPSNEGLGYWFVILWLNRYGNIGIKSPNIEHYEEKYGDERTREELSE